MNRGPDPRRRTVLAFLAIAGASPWVRAAAPAAIPLASDLRADGQLSRLRKEPIVILFSLPGCPYCEIVRRSHLAPLLADPQEGPRLIVRQLDVDSDRAVMAFSGERTTHERIARAHGVRAAPVVAFWDGAGRMVAEPLKGMLLPDFYSAYLDAAIETARARLRTGT